MATTKGTSISGSLAVSRDTSIGGRLTARGNATFGRDVYIDGWLNARNIRGAGKGLYETVAKLEAAYPKPHNGWYALVGSTLPADIYVAWGGQWRATGQQGGEPALELNKITELYNDLEDEITDRENADNDLKSEISVEAKTREAADDNLQYEIDNLKDTYMLNSMVMQVEGTSEAAVMSQNAVTELLHGSSAESSAYKDAFINIPDFRESIPSTVDTATFKARLLANLNTWLDGRHFLLTEDNQKYIGVCRIWCDGRNGIVLHHVLSYAADRGLQVIMGEWAIADDGTLKYGDNGKFSILYRERVSGSWGAWNNISGGSYSVMAYKVADSTNDLPSTATTDAYIINGHIYVYVGTGGDTKGGLWQDCGQFKGDKGDAGLSDEQLQEIENLKAAVEELQNAQYPMTISLSANPTKVGAYNIGWSVMRKGAAMTPDSLTLSKQVNNGVAAIIASDAKASGTVSSSVTGNKEVITLSVTKSGLGTKTVSSTKYVCYYGANAATDISETVINALMASITTGVGFNPTVITSAGQYIWLVVPSYLTINKVTSAGFEVPVTAATTITTSLGTFKAYRSTNQLTAATWKLTLL